MQDRPLQAFPAEREKKSPRHATGGRASGVLCLSGHGPLLGWPLKPSATTGFDKYPHFTTPFDRRSIQY
ncbi:hypothetical protein EWH08_17075 [Sphingobium indicum]|uniref:Uncharacterized protein n=2 Tax=Sphingobium indicum TaxID=332055 RepID=A0A4Q4IY37_9SPHN|nr:hypothetical protein [Sphingobium indicum]NYI24359.1 hypothetical protein [Sphingobium indicum]RYL98565.1 hypothetical protein EWH08_17075 [Sphingobium indicum]